MATSVEFVAASGLGSCQVRQESSGRPKGCCIAGRTRSKPRDWEHCTPPAAMNSTMQGHVRGAMPGGHARRPCRNSCRRSDEAWAHLQVKQQRLPLERARLHRLDEGRGAHGLRLDNLVVEQGLGRRMRVGSGLGGRGVPHLWSRHGRVPALTIWSSSRGKGCLAFHGAATPRFPRSTLATRGEGGRGEAVIAAAWRAVYGAVTAGLPGPPAQPFLVLLHPAWLTITSQAGGNDQLTCTSSDPPMM